MKIPSTSAFSWHFGAAWFVMLAIALNVAGCSSETGTGEKLASNSSQAPSSPAVDPSGQDDPTDEDRVASPSDPQSLAGAPGGRPIGAPIPAPGPLSSASGMDAPDSRFDQNSAESPTSPSTLPLLPGATPPDVKAPRLLRADLSPQQLIEFLAGADEDMRLVYSGAAGIHDNEDAIKRMREIGKLKLEAAKRLRDHADANDEQRVEGSRGLLQSLSHLAALGDLDSANELETLANENLNAADPRVVTDSRLVLIGFAIESLQHGKDSAPEKLVELVNGLRNLETKPDVPTLMVLGQARQMLSQYDHHEQAGKVREAIIDLFADAEDHEIATMAATLAGSVQFDAIEPILEAAIRNGDVSESQWITAAETLADESADIMTVQYLAGAALELEASGRVDLATVTYRMLDERFGSQSDSIGEEARIAIEANQARRRVIGTMFPSDLPQVDGSPLDISKFSGKIVLMPFWASGFPQSLQILPQLNAIRDEFPNQVVIVGMNLDPAGAPTQEFMAQNQLRFPSYQSVSSPTARVANEVATQFGMVSMPFVAILDPKGRVADLDFKGQKLRQVVQRLLPE